jgi:hypothetical protein
MLPETLIPMGKFINLLGIYLLLTPVLYLFLLSLTLYNFHRPKRYQLGELVDYFFRVMRKDKEWGYYRYDLRYAPLFWLKVSIIKTLV